ncbi:MAG: hypothetical protein ACLFMZ_09000, partial [Spirochaetaceae bacterium]
MTINRVYNKKPLIDLLSKTLDGEWGEGKEIDDHIEYSVIRGGDFPSVRNGNINSVPKRFIEKRKAKRKTLQPGDILIETAGGSRDRPTGRTIFLNQTILDKFNLPVTCASFA